MVQDYVAGTGDAQRFFVGAWSDPAAFQEKADEIDGRFDDEDRARAAAAVRAPTPQARERLERFVAESGYMVTTGQQPGLFTGPLYSIYKGLTAIALADELEQQLGKPVVPVFWVASEDHDWAEVSHTYTLDSANELHRIDVADPGGDSRRPIHRIRLGEELARAIDAFADIFPPTDFRDRALATLRGAYASGATLSDGFRDTIDALLGPLGLVTTDAADPVVKQSSAPLLWAALEDAEHHEAALTATGQRLEAAGYGAQVAVLPGAANVFLEGPRGRERVYCTDEGFRLHTSGQVLTADEIRARIASDPKLISPNVLLRPVVESHVFPTLSYVGGPGELAYWAQLGGYFEAQGIRMPVVYPRVSVTIVESKVAKVLGKFDIDASALGRPFHEVAAEFARDEVPEGVRRALGELRGAVGAGATRLIEESRGIDPTLKGPIQSARNAAFSAFNDAEKKIIQSLKRQSEIALGQLEKAQKNLFPDGHPQERILNIFQYLVRYGDALIPHLAERVRDQVRIKDVQVAVAEDA